MPLPFEGIGAIGDAGIEIHRPKFRVRMAHRTKPLQFFASAVASAVASAAASVGGGACWHDEIVNLWWFPIHGARFSNQFARARFPHTHQTMHGQAFQFRLVQFPFPHTQGVVVVVPHPHEVIGIDRTKRHRAHASFKKT